MKSLEAPYSVKEIRDALQIVHPTDAAAVMRRLHTNRLDAEERAAMAELAALADAGKGQTGDRWMVTQRLVAAAMRRADRAAAATAAYHRDAADPRKTIW